MEWTIKATSFCTLLFGVAVLSSGQPQAPQQNVSELIGKLQSKSESERSAAFERIRSNRNRLQDRRVRKALTDLLDRENHELDSRLAEAQKKGYPDEGDSGGFGTYYADLVGTVDSFANWSDPQQACILVDAASSDDSAFAAKIARNAKVTIPCLIRRSESNISMNRAVSVPILVQALSKASLTLDSATASSARQIILHALHDPDVAVRSFTVHALGKFGGQDMIAPLEEVARADPSPEVGGDSIRKSAAQAITAIKQRARLK